MGGGIIDLMFFKEMEGNMKNSFKKLIALFLSILFVICSASCNDGGGDNSTQNSSAYSIESVVTSSQISTSTQNSSQSSELVEPKTYRLEIGMIKDVYRLDQILILSNGGTKAVRSKFNNAVKSITVQKPNGTVLSYSVNYTEKSCVYSELGQTAVYPADCVIYEKYHMQGIEKVVDEWDFYSGASQLSNNLIYDTYGEDSLEIFIQTGDIVTLELVNFKFEGFYYNYEGEPYETYRWQLRNLLINSSLYENYFTDNELGGVYSKEDYNVILEGATEPDPHASFDNLLGYFSDNAAAEGLESYLNKADGMTDVIQSVSAELAEEFQYSFEVEDLTDSSEYYQIYLDYNVKRIAKPLPYTDMEATLYLEHATISEMNGEVAIELLSKAQKDEDGYIVWENGNIVPQDAYLDADYIPETVIPKLYNNVYGDIIQIVDETFVNGELISTPISYKQINENTVIYLKRIADNGDVVYTRFEHYYGGGKLRRRAVKFGAKKTTKLGQLLEEKFETDLTYADLWEIKTAEFESVDFVSNVQQPTKIDEGDLIRINIQPKEGYYISRIEIPGIGENGGFTYLHIVYDPTIVSEYVIKVVPVKGMMGIEEVYLAYEQDLSVFGGYIDLYVGDAQSLPYISVYYAEIDNLEPPQLAQPVG